MNELTPAVFPLEQTEVLIGERMAGGKPLLLIQVKLGESSWQRLFSVNEEEQHNAE